MKLPAGLWEEVTTELGLRTREGIDTGPVGGQDSWAALGAGAGSETNPEHMLGSTS